MKMGILNLGDNFRVPLNKNHKTLTSPMYWFINIPILTKLKRTIFSFQRYSSHSFHPMRFSYKYSRYVQYLAKDRGGATKKNFETSLVFERRRCKN